MTRILPWVLLVTACVSSDSVGSRSQPTTQTPGTGPGGLEVLSTIPDAVTANIAAAMSGNPVVAWISSGEVGVARLDPDTEELQGRQVINGDIDPLLHPIERPGLALGRDGTVHVAFTSLIGSAASVYYARVREDTADGPYPISGDPQPETNLVHVAVDDEETTALAWLEDSTLSVAMARGDGKPQETELVDDLTCDCCNPAPTFVGENVVVPFRDYGSVDGRVVRDVAAVRSIDGGETFDDPVEVADDHWFIDACPFSGPSTVEVNDVLIVAFMDGRQSVHPDQTSSSIWVDVSHDAGESFGTDLEVASDGINRWPVMTAGDSGVIHIVWEVQGPDGGLAYARSEDLGATFTEPFLILDSSESSGSPKSPSVAHHDGTLLVTWTDDEGAHVASMPVG